MTVEQFPYRSICQARWFVSNLRFPPAGRTNLAIGAGSFGGSAIGGFTSAAVLACIRGIGFRGCHPWNQVPVWIQKPMGQLILSDLNGTQHKFRQIDGLQERIVEVRILLGQQKGFAELSILVHVGEEWPGEKAVKPFAAENHPTSVAGPAMPGIRLGAVDFQPAKFARSHVQEVEIGVGLINWEISVIAETEHDKPSVWGDSRLTGAKTSLLR